MKKIRIPVRVRRENTIENVVDVLRKLQERKRSIYHIYRDDYDKYGRESDRRMYTNYLSELTAFEYAERLLTDEAFFIRMRDSFKEGY